MKFTVLINNYSPKYMQLQCWIFTGLQSGEVNIQCKPPTLTEVNIGLVYTQTVRQKKHKKMISIHLFLQGLQYFQAQICAHCSEVNRKGQLEFEWPIRLHLKCYPIFQHKYISTRYPYQLPTNCLVFHPAYRGYQWWVCPAVTNKIHISLARLFLNTY